MGNFTSKKYYSEEDLYEMYHLNLKFVIYKDRIYDIKHILNIDHPGGIKLIENNIGNDITYHMQFHSKKAKKMLKKHLIGYLKK